MATTLLQLILNQSQFISKGNVVVRQNKIRQNIGLRQAPILNRWKRGIRQIGIRQKIGVRQILRGSPAFFLF